MGSRPTIVRADDPSIEFYLARPAERNKSRFQRFLAREFAQGVMRTIGSLLNSHNSKIYLAYRPDSHFDFDSFPHFSDLYRHFVHESSTHNCGDLGRLYMLLLNVARVLKENIPGDIAEIGVYKGNTARILAEAVRAGGRRLYLFDTFGGFDPADLNDSHRPSLAFSDTSLDMVKTFIGQILSSISSEGFPIHYRRLRCLTASPSSTWIAISTNRPRREFRTFIHACHLEVY